jgi:hypothetical protein
VKNNIAEHILTPLETMLSKYLEDDRAAIAIAPFVTLPPDPTEEQIENAVIMALVKAKKAVGGISKVEYVAGRRCDVQRRLERQ